MRRGFFSKRIRCFLGLVLLVCIYYKYDDFTFTKSEDELPERNRRKQQGVKHVKSIFVHQVQNEIFLDLLKHKRQIRQHKPNVNIRVVREQKRHFTHQDYYLIVEYTRVFGQTKYCEHFVDSSKFRQEDQEFFARYFRQSKAQQPYTLLDKCHFKNCFFTCDKHFSKHADAILFHETDLKQEIHKKLTKDVYSKVSPLATRTSEQVWILWNDEANRVDAVMDELKFNWTISYKFESEVSYSAYGSYVPLVNSAFEKKLRQEFFDVKKEGIVWFVSNCNSKLRIDFALELGRYYPLNVFGSCNNELKRREQTEHIIFNSTKCTRESTCELEALTANKFYLAFESKNCTDYITEKLWRTLSFNIIPVVLQPSKESYERIAPKDSFIHIADFDFDARKLGAYLRKVSSNFNLFKRYLAWKEHYVSRYTGFHLEQYRMCELCHRLNTDTSVSYYTSVSKFFNDECIIN